MFFCGTEHDGLGHAVRVLQILGDFTGDLPMTVLEDDVVVVIRVIVDSVLDDIPEDVLLPKIGTPAVADVGLDVDDTERGEEAVVDAVPQAVSIKWLAEIVDVRYVFRLLRCCGHADLGCRGEVFKDGAPGAVGLCGPAMALVHNHQVEEIGGEQLLVVGFVLIFARQLLIEGKIDLVGGYGRWISRGVVDLVDGFLQGREILLDGGVNKEIAVGKIKNFLLGPAFQQAVHDLEGSVCLARAGGHCQQKALLAPGDGRDGSVDSHTLVVAGRPGIGAGVVWLLAGLDFSLAQTIPSICACLVSGDKFFLCGEGVHGNVSLHACQKVELHKGITVGAVGKRHVQHLRVFLGLLQSV